MSAKWKFQEFLASRGVVKASDAHRIIQQRTGHEISKQAVSKLLTRSPKMIRVETAVAICDAFYCQLSDFFEIGPPANGRRQFKAMRDKNGERRSDKQDGASTRGKVDFADFFPDPRSFSS